MPAASILIKPTSANCNMDCKYCFYKCLSSNREEYSKGFMTEETLEQLIIQAFEYAEGSVTFAFQGGEPTLAGIMFFEKALELQKKHNTKGLQIENTIQTNGILIDEDWAGFLAKNRFLVGLSLDGPKKIHDCYRTGIAGEGTFEKVMHTVELFDKYHVEYNILSVITNESAKKASYLYKFFKRHGFSYLQFIPCMDEMNRKESNALRNEFAVEPVNYGKFLCEMFDLWYEDFSSGYQMDIRMFSNLAQMVAGFPAEECGMNGHCNCYFVVEGDGSVYPCDFYCMDEWKLGTVENGFCDMIQSEKAGKFIASSQSVSEKCKGCKYFSLCKGGCRRWREPFVNGKPELNYLCEAYEIFFEHTWERIQKLGQYIEKKYGIR